MKICHGLVHVYTGDGKGKTTCALGVVLRALGWGANVCLIQFIKGYAEIGEALFSKEFADRFTFKQFAIDLSRNISEDDVLKRKDAVQSAMLAAEEAVHCGKYDVVVLDEINNAVHYGLIDAGRVLSLMNERPECVELILTGRDAPNEIIEAADYVTEMNLIKHPFQKEIQARKGIDY